METGAVDFQHAALQRSEQRPHQDGRYNALAAGVTPGYPL